MNTPINHLTAGFIGLGLIGGSIARGLKRSAPDIQIMAYMRTREKLEQAHTDGIVDLILDGVDEHLSECDIIFLCTPVEFNESYLRQIRPFLKEGAVVTDVGSTKTSIHETVAALGMESCFVGGHPMAGSEKTGYESSTDHLLENAYYIITPTPHTPAYHTDRMVDVAKAIGALPLVLDYHRHDFIVAIQHLSDIACVRHADLFPHDRRRGGNTGDILETSGSQPFHHLILAVAVVYQVDQAGGDEVLDRYIDSLTTLREELSDHQSRAIYQLFESSRDYRNSFAETPKGSIQPEYTFSADVVDEPGAISIISSILSGKGISIKNIGISHNREHGEGALRISFYDKASMEAAWARLKKYNYTLFA